MKTFVDLWYHMMPGAYIILIDSGENWRLKDFTAYLETVPKLNEQKVNFISITT